MPDILPWVWLAIGITFFYFAIVFYQYSQRNLRSFSIRERQQKVLDDEPVPEDMNIFHELIHDFEQYLESINKQNVARSRIASIGFFLAGIASFIAAYIA
jgi:hypothetical protein